MALIIQVPQNTTYLMVTGAIDWNSDTFKLILCTDFIFDIDTDIGYADISSYELGDGFGYTNGGHILAGDPVFIDNGNNDSRQAFDKLTITASGGDIGPFQKMMVYDDTATGNPIIVCFTYSSETTITDGGKIDFENIIARFETPDSL